MLSILSALAVATAPLQDTAHVVVVATTDVHGHATDWDYPRRRPFSGGLARVATVVDSLRVLYPGMVVVADAGDVLQGDAFATYFAKVKPHDPHPVIEAMNLAGYDVATLGSHEFDFGLPTMQQALGAARFPYVSANITSPAGDTLLYPRYVVLRRQGVRIGVTGFTTPGAMVWNREQLRGKMRIGRIPEAASRVFETMRKETDVVLALVHSGMDGPASYDTAGIGSEHNAMTLATLLVRPDLVVVGHSHRELRDSVIGGVHFVQPRPFGTGVSITHLDLAKREDRWRLIRVRSELVSTAQVAPSPRLTSRLARAHGAVLGWVDLPLGRATGPMPATAARAEPTAILNFVNAVQRSRTGADLSAASAFDLTAGFDTGTIRVGQVVALYPFDNTLRAVRVTGAQLKAYLEQSARYFRADPVDRISLNDSVPGYNYDVIAGARYEIDLRKPVGERIQKLTVRGRLVQGADTFTLALNSYRQSGVGGYSMLRDAPVVYDKGENIRDLLMEEIRRRGELDPTDYPSQEWRIVPEATATAVRALFQVPVRPAVAEQQDSVLLRVLATADLHGALTSKPDADGKPTGGMAVLAGLMDSLAADCGCPTVRLDAGDAMQGTVASNISRGRPMVEVLSRLNLTAAAVGEHDLEWSVDTLRRRMSEARYPWLVANIYDSSTKRRPDWVSPYRVLQAGGLKVAIVGYITSEAKSRIKPELTAGLQVGDGALAIHDVLTEIGAQRPDLTILLAHAGASCQGAACSGEVIRIAEGVDPRSLDLLVGGHTHNLVNTRVAGIAIIEPGSDGAHLAVADLVKTIAGAREVRTRLVPVSPEKTTPSPAIAALVETHLRRADSLSNRVILAVKFPLARSGDQSRLGNLIAEARRNVLRTDVGLVSTAGIRADLPAGQVTYGQLFEIQPSQYRLMKVTLSGRQLRELLEHSIAGDGRPLAHVSGVKVGYDPRARKKRIRTIELAGGRPLRSNATYTLAVDEFLAAGGEGYTMLSGLPSEPAGMLDIEGLLVYLRRLPQPITVGDAVGFSSIRR
jgi:2',3'-cyclic-nucleotide 2'-phosphodiesterase / 3'-nucleotidase / 5'-nucleotidase